MFLKIITVSFILEGTNGFNRFNPNEIERDSIAPKLNFKELQINGVPKDLSGNHIEIKPDDRYFSLEFSSIHSVSQSEIELYYTMTGFKNHWEKLRDNYITFTNLDYGEYLLKVKAVNRNGVENSNYLTYDIKVLVPWYLSNWAFLIYLILAIILYLAIRWVVKNWRYIMSPKTKFFMNYKITREIGSGGIGTVYEAIDLNTKNRVALKLIKNDDLNDDTFLTTFLKEAELGQKLRHKNLTEIYHAGNEENTKYLVMEFLEGQTLRHHIKQKTVTVDNAFPLIKQIAEGLHYMHEKGVVHRDLKATNIIIIKDNIVKIFDFGLSSASMLVSLSDRTQRVWTLVYMSPEQSI